MLIHVPDLLKQSIGLYLKHWRHLFPYMMLFFLPLLLLSTLGLLSLFLSAWLPTSDFANSLLLLIVFFLSLLFSFWASVALSVAIKDLVTTGTTGHWRAVLRNTARLLAPVIWVSLLSLLAVLVGSVLFIVPGVIVAVWFMFSGYGVMFDGQRGIGALRASKRLTEGRWWAVAWRIFGPLFVLGVVTSFISYLASYPLFFLGSYQVTPVSGFTMAHILAQFGGSVVSSFFNSILTPLSTIPLILLYTNLQKTPAEQHTLPISEFSPPTGA